MKSSREMYIHTYICTNITCCPTLFESNSISNQEESHVPLRCEEVEKDDEVKARTKLENAMTEAMIRQCPKCKNRFVLK